MVTEVAEQVSVVVLFSGGKILPRIFVWRNRKYQVGKVTAAWSEYEGEAKRYFFSVTTDGANLYELSFHTRTLAWELLRIQSD